MNTKLVNQDFYPMKTNFTRIADYIYKQVTVNDVLKEAVMNSIQANATNINVYFQYEYTKTLDGDTSNLGNLSKIIIEDNGDGLTQKNIDAFLEVATNHKENIGGKGIGRISFLKIASSIQVESISIEKKHIDFDFSYNTDENSIKTRDCANQDAYTKITLSDLNLKHPKTQAASCANFLKEKFNLMLFLKQKETQKEISINFFVNNKLVEIIKSSNIHCLKTIDYSNNDCKFSIYAFHNNEK